MLRERSITEQIEKPLILIVDDHEANILILEQILGSNGFQTLTAMDGKKALEVIKMATPDLILLDIMMPEMNGFECCRCLKEIDSIKQVPIIFLTSRSSSEDIVAAFDVGAADYINKPFRIGELLSRIRTHLDLKNAIKTNQAQQKELSELIHILCHDLANPLHTLKLILNYSEEYEDLSPDHLKNMKINAEHMEGIIDLVRNMMAMKEGKDHIEMTEINLLTALNSSIQILDQKFKDKDITPEIKISPDIQVWANITSLVNSVLNNILTNAIKFSNPRTPIQIVGKTENKRVILSIQDFGIGIPSEILEIIFKIDRRTSRFGTNGEKGVGFGMPLVKKFMDSYGGRIEIFSKTEVSGTEKTGTRVDLIFKKT